jgi:hypothetical protein
MGGGALVMLIFKILSFIRKEQEGQSSSVATGAQFKMLQEQISQNHSDFVDLKAVVNVMDKTIHKQQRTITRMEMLLRQFTGLVKEQGIEVPDYMQEELDELITASEDRSRNEQNRRNTDP